MHAIARSRSKETVVEVHRASAFATRTELYHHVRISLPGKEIRLSFLWSCFTEEKKGDTEGKHESEHCIGKKAKGLGKIVGIKSGRRSSWLNYPRSLLLCCCRCAGQVVHIVISICLLRVQL